MVGRWIKGCCCIVLSLSIFTGCSFEEKEDFSYSQFAAVVSYPKDKEDWYDREIEFTAVVLEEPFDLSSTDKEVDGKKFITLMISRDLNSIIYAQVDDIKDIPKAGEIVNVEAKVSGYLYGTHEGEQLESLHISVDNITKKKASKDKAKNTSKMKGIDKKHTIDLKHVQLTKDHDGSDIVYIYFEYKNVDQTIGAADLSELDVMQGETGLEAVESIMLSDDPSPDALRPRTTVDKGETSLVYATYKLKNTETPLSFYMYGDDFNKAYEYTMPLK